MKKTKIYNLIVTVIKKLRSFSFFLMFSLVLSLIFLKLYSIELITFPKEVKLVIAHFKELIAASNYSLTESSMAFLGQVYLVNLLLILQLSNFFQSKIPLKSNNKNILASNRYKNVQKSNYFYKKISGNNSTIQFILSDRQLI